MYINFRVQLLGPVTFQGKMCFLYYSLTFNHDSDGLGVIHMKQCCN